MEIISCNNLTIGYKSDIVQKDISFKINSGDYVCIVGENGAGKTTLVKTLLGLIPPVSGKVVINDSIKKNGIGYLPQQGVIQRNFPTSVKEVILSGMQNRIKLFYTQFDKESAARIARKLHIEELLEKKYSDLSGGQQQKVLLARAFLASDKLLVLDEPVTGLDIRSQSSFYHLVNKLNKEGTTIIMITHDANPSSQNISHILKVEGNKTVLRTFQRNTKWEDMLNGETP